MTRKYSPFGAMVFGKYYIPKSIRFSSNPSTTTFKVVVLSPNPFTLSRAVVIFTVGETQIASVS